VEQLYKERKELMEKADKAFSSGDKSTGMAINAEVKAMNNKIHAVQK